MILSPPALSPPAANQSQGFSTHINLVCCSAELNLDDEQLTSCSSSFLEGDGNSCLGLGEDLDLADGREKAPGACRGC